jgi:hypothetical protein
MKFVVLSDLHLGPPGHPGDAAQDVKLAVIEAVRTEALARKLTVSFVSLDTKQTWRETCAPRRCS